LSLKGVFGRQAKKGKQNKKKKETKMKIQFSSVAKAITLLLTTKNFINAKKSPSTNSIHKLASQLSSNGRIPADSTLGTKVLQQARQLDNRNVDYTFIGGYSIKFQGCHHINQWNEYAEDEDDVRIMTKRLIRFRLCPSDDCNDEKTGGCNYHYGDYVMDMNVFVEAYLEAKAEDLEAECEAMEEICENQCDGNDDEDSCMASCYGSYGLSACVEADDDAAVEMLDPTEYAYCAQYNFPDRDDDGGQDDAAEEIVYYVGPYCADQGGEINLGLFTDDTCTTFADGGKSQFYELAGYELPYGSANMVNENCMSCMDSGDDDDANEWDDGMDQDNIKMLCATAYLDAGKCETKMTLDYPNEAACTYIEGIKIIREDGVIRTTSVKKSRAAAVSIGLSTTVAVLLGAYIYYLRTKLSRAKISISSQG